MMTPSGKDDALSGWALKVSHFGLHSDFPGLSDANEIAGGTPAYSRVPAVWNAPAGGSVARSGTPLFNVPGGGTPVRWIGGWSALTGGTMGGYWPNMPPNTTSHQVVDADLTNDVITTKTPHLFSNGQTITFYGGTPPAGLVEGAIYYARDVTTKTFKVAATAGGAAIDLTSAGAVTVQVSRIVEEVFGGQGEYKLNSLTQDLNG